MCSTTIISSMNLSSGSVVKDIMFAFALTFIVAGSILIEVGDFFRLLERRRSLKFACRNMQIGKISGVRPLVLGKSPRIAETTTLFIQTCAFLLYIKRIVHSFGEFMTRNVWTILNFVMQVVYILH